MGDEVRAAAAYGAKVEHSIVEARVNARGAIMELRYEAAATEAGAIEDALKASLATVTPAPSVVEVRYAHEYNREIARAAKKYGGGVLVKEATAIARLWCRDEWGTPPGRGIPYSTLQQIAYDVHGLTLPGPIIYQFSGYYSWFDWNTETGGFDLVPVNKKCMSRWDNTYGFEQYYRAWVRIIVPEIYRGTSRALWVRYDASDLKTEAPWTIPAYVWALPVANLHPMGLVETQECYDSLWDWQGTPIEHDFEDLTPAANVASLGTISIPADGAVELAFLSDDADFSDDTYEDSFSLAGAFDLLFDAP